MGSEGFCIPGNVVPSAAFETGLALDCERLEAQRGVQPLTFAVGKRDQGICRSDALQKTRYGYSAEMAPIRAANSFSEGRVYSKVTGVSMYCA